MSSAAEAEIRALYVNSQEAIPTCHTLKKMGHPHPLTPMQTDNTTALGVVTHTIHPKRIKAMDMRFHWLRPRKLQKHFRNYRREGPTNKGGCVTKNNTAVHHRNVRPYFLTPRCQLDLLRKAIERRASRKVP